MATDVLSGLKNLSPASLQRLKRAVDVCVRAPGFRPGQTSRGLGPRLITHVQKHLNIPFPELAPAVIQAWLELKGRVLEEARGLLEEGGFEIVDPAPYREEAVDYNFSTVFEWMSGRLGARTEDERDDLLLAAWALTQWGRALGPAVSTEREGLEQASADEPTNRDSEDFVDAEEKTRGESIMPSRIDREKAPYAPGGVTDLARLVAELKKALPDADPEDPAWAELEEVVANGPELREKSRARAELACEWERRLGRFVSDWAAELSEKFDLDASRWSSVTGDISSLPEKIGALDELRDRLVQWKDLGANVLTGTSAIRKEKRQRLEALEEEISELGSCIERRNARSETTVPGDYDTSPAPPESRGVAREPQDEPAEPALAPPSEQPGDGAAVGEPTNAQPDSPSRVEPERSLPGETPGQGDGEPTPGVSEGYIHIPSETETTPLLPPATEIVGGSEPQKDPEGSSAPAAEAEAEADLATMANERAWTLLGDGFVSLAYQTARELDRRQGGPGSHLRGSEVELAHLAPYVFPGVDEVLERTEAVARTLLDEPGPDARSADHSVVGRVVLRAATLPRIVLFAPNGPSHALLRQLVLEDFGVLNAVRGGVEAILRLGVELTPVKLRGDSSEQDQASSLREWKAHALEWLRLNRQTGVLNLSYATDVLRAWSRAEGPLGGALEKAISNTPDAREVAGRITGRWKDPGFVQAELIKQDRAYRGTKADRKPIEARAREVLLHRAESAVKLLLGWLELVDLRSERRTSHGDRELLRCRQDLLSAAAEAKEHLSAATTAAGSPIRKAAFGAAVRQMSELVTLLSSDSSRDERASFDAEELSRDLLRIPGLVLDSRCAPPLERELLPRLLSLPPVADWPAAFEMQTAARNPWAMELISRLIDSGPQVADQESRAAEIKRVREERESELRNALSDARRAIGRALRYSLLPEADLQDLRAEVETIAPGDTRDFGATGALIEKVIARVENGEQARVAEATERMLAAAPKMREGDRERVERALRDRNYSVVDDYLDRVENGVSIDEPKEEVDPFDRFFPMFVREWTELLSVQPRPTNQAVVHAVRSRARLGPLDATSLDEESARTGAALVEAWMRARERLGSARAQQIKDILLGIGLSEVSIQGNPPSSASRWATTLSVTPIKDRDTCPLPHWGSMAGGRYQLICQWAQFTPDALISHLNVDPGRPPAIILAFSTLSENVRREIAAFCREKRKPALLLDEALLIYLACCGSSRLGSFFRCALPFTHSDPYLTNAGVLPPEMFFGRTRERESILKPDGTCLVYGGRQLGKTALLRDVERRYHDPERGSFVRWIDLKAELLGTARRLEDVWNVLGAALQRENIGSGATPTAETFERAVSRWLGQRGNRMLFLLDEADAFLEADRKQGQGYPVLLKLKQLMDKTERRFKVVFAGLHNVQRTSREANTPLAHLGRPLCIGPLLEGGEAGEAQDLIQVPLRACGYRFEGNGADLPVHILSHTNYYPSLIQIYCKHLLGYLESRRTRPEYRTAPPFVITQKHLDDAQDQKLRDEIRHRFRLTLDLDPRYRVIGLCIAHEAAATNGRSVLVEGVDVNWVRDQALTWWKQGFAGDTSLESFRTILDEMVGLGLLRPTGAGRWTLRSHNVLNVLGTRHEIEEDLLDASEKEPPPNYEPASIRRTDPEDIVRRSPLTGQQETDVLSYENGVSVLFGVPMGGLNDVVRFLRLAAPGAPVHEISDAGSRAALVMRLEEVLTATPEGLSLAVVSPASPWTADWVVGALHSFKARTVRRGSTVRVVFVGDAHAAWGWTDPASRDVDECRRRMVRVISLHPWSGESLSLWLQDQAIILNAEERQRVLELSGGWPTLLEEWAKHPPRDGKASPESMVNLLRERSDDRTWRPALGLARELNPVLALFAEYGPSMSAGDLEMVAQGAAARSEIERVLAWSELIGIVRKDDVERYSLNSLVMRLAKPGA